MKAQAFVQSTPWLWKKTSPFLEDPIDVAAEIKIIFISIDIEIIFLIL